MAFEGEGKVKPKAKDTFGSPCAKGLADASLAGAVVRGRATRPAQIHLICGPCRRAWAAGGTVVEPPFVIVRERLPLAARRRW